jgi:hypothetical protein
MTNKSCINIISQLITSLLFFITKQKYRFINVTRIETTSGS